METRSQENKGEILEGEIFVKKGQKLKLSKVFLKPETPKDEDVLPEEYWLIGFALFDFKLGETMFIDRRIKNGEEILGIFTSTLIISAKKDSENFIKVTTKNSVWQIQFLAD